MSSTNKSTSCTIYPNEMYDSCGSRLPCGICRLTNLPCPKHVQKMEVTF